MNLRGPFRRSLGKFLALIDPSVANTDEAQRYSRYLEVAVPVQSERRAKSGKGENAKGLTREARGI